MALMLGRLFGVFGLIVVCHLVFCEDLLPKGLKCVSCMGRLSLLHCNQIETCEHDDEICYVEEEIDIGGQIVINAGCRKKAICDSKGCFNDVNRRKRDVIPRHRRHDTREQICHHCCDTELCNMYGCSDTGEVDNFKGIRCVVCTLSFHPNLCTTIQNCEEGEYCYTSLNVRATATDTVVKRFTTGCMKSNVCDKLEALHLEHASARKKRSYTQIHSECCKSHLCNRNIPLAVDLPVRQSDTYVCPARSITTESTTKATVKPFALEEVCEDKLDNCHEYGSEYICTGDYIPWAKINCRKFCQLCDPCEDKIAECPAYGYDYICKGDYIPWSLINCRKFCNLCSVTTPRMGLTEPATSTKGNGMSSTESSTIQYSTATTTPVSTPEPCEDMDYNCADYGYDYICSEDFIPWSNIHCRKFCNLCDTTSTTGTTTIAECRDKLDNCAAYGRDYICTGDYIPWSLINCPLFCGLCAGQGSGTSTVVTITTTADGITEQTSSRTTQVPPTSASASSIGTLSTSSTSSTESTSIINTTALREMTEYVSNSTTTRTEASTTLSAETTPSAITYTTSSSAEMITTIGASTTDKLCVDTLDCSVYSVKLVCHGEFLNWAYQHCSKYCGFCKDQSETPTTSTTSTESTTTSSPTTPMSTTTIAPVTAANDPSCQDVVNCAGLESKCGDVSEHEWMYQNCRRTCQMCQESPLCVDEIHDCASLASLICDLGLNPELKPQCKKTCKLC